MLLPVKGFPSDSTIAPVLIVAFNRPHLVQALIKRLRMEKPPILFFAQDGPRANNSEDVSLCKDVLKALDFIDWHCELIILKSKTNLGTRDRVFSAVEEVLRRHDRLILLEDDCLPSSGFLRWASIMLERFEHDDSIGMISGNRFNRPSKFCSISTMPRTWGWATWKSSWQGFDPKKALPAQELRQAIARNVRGKNARRHWSRRYLNSVTDKHMWDVQWTAYLWVTNRLTIVPPLNLVSNHGTGASATHSIGPSIFTSFPAPEEVDVDSMQFQKIGKRQLRGEPVLLRVEAVVGILDRVGQRSIAMYLAKIVKTLIGRQYS